MEKAKLLYERRVLKKSWGFQTEYIYSNTYQKQQKEGNSKGVICVYKENIIALYYQNILY